MTSGRYLWGSFGLLVVLGASAVLAVWFTRPVPKPVESVEVLPEAPEAKLAARAEPVAPPAKEPEPNPPLSAEEEAWRREEAKFQLWRQQFQAELKAAPDPVAVAVRVAKDPDPDRAVQGVEALVKYWEDPRAELLLAELGKG